MTTLKELAFMLSTDEEIVILEELDNGELEKTKYFSNSDEFFTDSLNNVLWPKEFYNREVLWIAPVEDYDTHKRVVRVRID